MIAGGRDDVDAGASGGFDRLHERIGFGGLVDRMAERQVDDVDAKPVFVRGGVLDRADDVAGQSLPVSVEHLQHDQARFGGEAAVSLLTLRAVAGDEAGDVRAVAVRVARGPRDAPLREVVEGDDAVAELGSGLDAGVDHRDADAIAARRLNRQAQRAAQRIW